MSLPVAIMIAVVGSAIYGWLLSRYWERIGNWWKARHCTCDWGPVPMGCMGTCPHALKQYQKDIEDFLASERTTV